MWLIVSASDWTLKAEWRNFLTQIEKEGDAWPLYTCLRFTRTLSDLRVFGKLERQATCEVRASCQRAEINHGIDTAIAQLAERTIEFVPTSECAAPPLAQMLQQLSAAFLLSQPAGAT